MLIDDSINAVAAAIIHLLKNQDLQALFKKNARNSVLNKDFENIAQTSLIPLYRSL
jgi:hypothetical protein